MIKFYFYTREYVDLILMIYASRIGKEKNTAGYEILITIH